ncbi:hypothetical protein PASE110613_17420 [Paenibacillus sediminis]|uniref:Small, acid-soluble spore protein gamma-type n=1 Tax=Paenibacillus sediminis TaxID=664909 RepID=A0ABS4H837_9BACL|nr:hypothetical protein [Paenibacillus sediminis]MBP1938631.1 hypothetical protein [Paenibacillus sediminis]
MANNQNNKTGAGKYKTPNEKFNAEFAEENSQTIAQKASRSHSIANSGTQNQQNKQNQ